MHSKVYCAWRNSKAKFPECQRTRLTQKGLMLQCAEQLRMSSLDGIAVSVDKNLCRITYTVPHEGICWSQEEHEPIPICDDDTARSVTGLLLYRTHIVTQGGKPVVPFPWDRVTSKSLRDNFGNNAFRVSRKASLQRRGVASQRDRALWKFTTWPFGFNDQEWLPIIVLDTEVVEEAPGVAAHRHERRF